MFSRKASSFVKAVAGTAGVIGLGVGTIYVTRPDILVGAVVDLQRYRIGLRRRYVVLDDGFQMSYAERGKPQPDIPTMVMLHGYSGSLDAAVPVVKKLPKHIHVIAVDAPGHGKTKHVCDDDLRPKVMAQRLQQFVMKKKLDESKFHLVGWAMGGTIAGFYAAQYPQNLKLLTLAAPGMNTPIMSQFMQDTLKGDIHIVLPVTEEEQKRFWKMVLYKNNDLPQSVRDYLQRKKTIRREDHLKVFRTMIEEAIGQKENAFVKAIRNIRTPTQIIWGDKDALEDISGVEVLESALGDCMKRKDIIPDCGHAFYGEEPETLAALLVGFQADYRLKGREWEKQKHSGKDNKGLEGSPMPTQDMSFEINHVSPVSQIQEIQRTR